MYAVWAIFDYSIHAALSALWLILEWLNHELKRLKLSTYLFLFYEEKSWISDVQMTFLW